MAITFIRKKGASGEYQNLKMETILFKEDGEDGKEALGCRVTIADDDLKDLSEATIYAVNMPEEEFHTDLRKEAAAKKQLITSHSTDPEWNPEGYTKNLEDEV
jgi:hypothetical protein